MQRVVDSKAMDDVGAAIAHLKSQSNVKSGSLGVIGFCMGGRLTYLTAAHHANDIKAAVPYYGGGIPMGNPSPLSRTGEMTEFHRTAYSFEAFRAMTEGGLGRADQWLWTTPLFGEACIPHGDSAIRRNGGGAFPIIETTPIGSAS